MQPCDFHPVVDLLPWMAADMAMQQVQGPCQRRANGDRKSALARRRIRSGQNTGTGRRDARDRVDKVTSVGGRNVNRVTQMPTSDNDALIGPLERDEKASARLEPREQQKGFFSE